MAVANFQTIKLSQGKHCAPEYGACVMELASMLASEPFSDHPTSVCPVIGSFLRAYNDSIDDKRRQDLYAYAAKVVGCRAGTEVETKRGNRLAAWRLEMARRRRRFIPLPPAMEVSGWWKCQVDSVGTQAVAAIRRHTDETHSAALALVEELLAIGQPEQVGHSRQPLTPGQAGDGIKAAPYG